MYVLLQFPHNHTGNFNSHLMRPSTNRPHAAILMPVFQKCHDRIPDHGQAVFLTADGNS